MVIVHAPPGANAETLLQSVEDDWSAVVPAGRAGLGALTELSVITLADVLMTAIERAAPLPSPESARTAGLTARPDTGATELDKDAGPVSSEPPIVVVVLTANV